MVSASTCPGCRYSTILKIGLTKGRPALKTIIFFELQCTSCIETFDQRFSATTVEIPSYRPWSPLPCMQARLCFPLQRLYWWLRSSATTPSSTETPPLKARCAHALAHLLPAEGYQQPRDMDCGQKARAPPECMPSCARGIACSLGSGPCHKPAPVHVLLQHLVIQLCQAHYSPCRDPKTYLRYPVLANGVVEVLALG